MIPVAVESMNIASIWKLPVIYVCENNRYAESTPFEFTVAGASIANRAAGYDMPGVNVDGQNVLDMFEVGREAVARARAGKGCRRWIQSPARRCPLVSCSGH